MKNKRHALGSECKDAARERMDMDVRQEASAQKNELGRIRNNIVTGCLLILMIAALWVTLTWATRTEVNTIRVLFSSPCQYAGCQREAETEYYATVWGFAMSCMPANENYTLDGGSYTSTDTYHVPKTDTYLVPDGDRIRVEKERRWEERTSEGSTRSYLDIEGAYCSIHAAEGQKLIQSAVSQAELWGNPLFSLPLLAAVASLFLLTVKKLRWKLAEAIYNAKHSPIEEKS